MKPRNHVLLFVGILAVVVGLRSAWSSHYARENAELGAKFAWERRNDMERAWQRLTYTNVPPGRVAEALLAKIDWPALELSPVQDVRLRVRLRQLLDYFGDPKFETYYRLKTEGLSYRFSPSPGVLELLAKSAPALTNGPLDPAKITQHLWSIVDQESGKTVVPRLTAVALGHVAGALSRTNSGGSLLSGKVGTGVTIAREALNPGFIYAGNVESPRGQRSPGLYFEWRFFAKANGSANAAPVFVSLYWSDRDQNWALNRLITDQWLGVATVF